MNSIKRFSLNIRRVVSRVFKVDIFWPIYAGSLKGYRFLVDTNIYYFDSSYENSSFGLILNELKKNPSAVVYDAGANIGYFSLLCSVNSGGRAHIYAFEPIAANMAILCRHLLLNKIRNITPVSLAVSDHSGIKAFSAENSPVSYTYQQESAYYGSRDVHVKVCTAALDTLTLEHGFLKPDILKIDVEGAEYDVLKGAIGILKKHRPFILLSTHEAHVKGIEHACLDILQEMGYQCSKLANEPGRMKGLNDYWCMPK